MLQPSTIATWQRRLLAYPLSPSHSSPCMHAARPLPHKHRSANTYAQACHGKTLADVACVKTMQPRQQRVQQTHLIRLSLLLKRCTR
jgi:hypothetical protein